jgi:hypothetical protein
VNGLRDGHFEGERGRDGVADGGAIQVARPRAAAVGDVGGT